MRGRPRGRAATLAPWVALGALAAGCAVAEPKALVIGIDGLLLEELALADTPALDALAANGAIASGAAGSGAPEAGAGGDGAEGWSVLLGGARAPLDGTATLFARLKAARPDAETGCFVASSALGLEPGALLGASRAAIDCALAPRDDGRPAGERDREAAGAAVEALTGAGRFGGADCDLVVVHLAQCGGAGAAGPERRAAIEAADALVGELVAALRARPTRGDEQWLVLVTAAGAGEPGPLALVAAADGVLPRRLDLEGATAVDLAPTVLAWLGVEPAAELEGRARVRR